MYAEATRRRVATLLVTIMVATSGAFAASATVAADDVHALRNDGAVVADG